MKHEPLAAEVEAVELEADGFKGAAMQMEGQTNKAFVAAQTGRLIEGTVTKRLELTHGPHVMVETQRFLLSSIAERAGSDVG